MQVDFNKYNLDETVENYLLISMFESIVETNEAYENSKGNPYRAKDGKFTFGTSKAKDSSKPKMNASQALYNYQDYGYRDINDYLWLHDKKNLDDYDKKRLSEITGDSSRLSKVEEHIEAIDSAFNSDKAKTGGAGHRIDTGIATDIFSSTEIGDTINNLKEENMLPENHTEWYDTKAEGAKRLEGAVKSLIGTNYKFKGYISTDAEMSSAYDGFSQGNTGISSLGMETYVQISSNKVKTLRVNDFTGMDSHMGQDNPENEILFNRNSTFEIYHAAIKPTSAEGYSGPRGEGFQLVLYMKDVDKSNNSANNKFDNKGNPYRAKDGKFTFGPAGKSSIDSSGSKSKSKDAAKTGDRLAKLEEKYPLSKGQSRDDFDSGQNLADDMAEIDYDYEISNGFDPDNYVVSDSKGIMEEWVHNNDQTLMNAEVGKLFRGESNEIQMEYDKTQEYFKKVGVKEIELSRGIVMKKDDFNSITKDGKIKLDKDIASSWTNNGDISKNFASDYNADTHVGFVITKKVPTENIVSSWRTNQLLAAGAESEFIVHDTRNFEDSISNIEIAGKDFK